MIGQTHPLERVLKKRGVLLYSLGFRVFFHTPHKQLALIVERSGHFQFGHSLPTNLAKPQAWKGIKWTMIPLSGVLNGGYIGDYMGVFIKGDTRRVGLSSKGQDNDNTNPQWRVGFNGGCCMRGSYVGPK